MVFHGFYKGGLKSKRGGSSRVLDQISDIKSNNCMYIDFSEYYCTANDHF